MLLQPLAVDLGVHEDVGEVVERGRVLAPLGDHLAAALEDLRDVLGDHRRDPLGVEVDVGGAERAVHQRRPDRVVLFGDAHEAPDHARDDGLRDVVDEIASLLSLEAVEHPTVIARISSSWAAIRFGVKPAWKSCLSRSCLGGSMPMNIARSNSIGK